MTSGRMGTWPDQVVSLLEAFMPSGYQDARAQSETLGRDAISLSIPEGRLLSLLVRLHGGKKWVEIGTLTGFSGLCIMQGLGSDGRLWTVEKDPRAATAARKVFESTQHAKQVLILEKDSSQALAEIASHGPFDGIFVDGAKNLYQECLEWARVNIRPGGLLIFDNVYLGRETYSENPGRWNQPSRDRMKQVIQELLNPVEFDSSLIPTAEGLLVAIKRN